MLLNHLTIVTPPSTVVLYLYKSTGGVRWGGGGDICSAHLSVNTNHRSEILSQREFQLLSGPAGLLAWPPSPLLLSQIYNKTLKSQNIDMYTRHVPFINLLRSEFRACFIRAIECEIHEGQCRSVGVTQQDVREHCPAHFKLPGTDLH